MVGGIIFYKNCILLISSIFRWFKPRQPINQKSGVLILHCCGRASSSCYAGIWGSRIWRILRQEANKIEASNLPKQKTFKLIKRFEWLECLSLQTIARPNHVNMFNATAQNRFVPYGAQYYTSLFLNYWEFLSKKDSDWSPREHYIKPVPIINWEILLR